MGSNMVNWVYGKLGKGILRVICISAYAMLDLDR